MVVVVARISASMLTCVGARCWTSTNAMPVSAGRAWSRCLKASRPPADAPMPTIGKESSAFSLPEPSAAAADVSSMRGPFVRGCYVREAIIPYATAVVFSTGIVGPRRAGCGN